LVQMAVRGVSGWRSHAQCRACAEPASPRVGGGSRPGPAGSGRW